ncbi:MAG: tyrosine-type recombinase/integrase [Lentisphaeria bacterium]|nr:site-specific integrase [Lentisphaeria bacterium]NQZ67205.1 tyrosine-type recombinase/integrase [Lentisphaeria bacterium]
MKDKMKNLHNLDEFEAEFRPLVPGIINQAGEEFILCYMNFFITVVRNPNTRESYLNSCNHFFEWATEKKLGFLEITAPLISSYIDIVESDYCPMTAKHRLYSLRQVFDYFANTGLMETNPSRTVKAPRFSRREGATPVLAPHQVLTLIESIETDTNKGMRDRTMIAVMAYVFARVSAVCSLKVNDYHDRNGVKYLRLHEKGGKEHLMPVHHELINYLDAYLIKTGLHKEPATPLFRSFRGRSDDLTAKAIGRVSTYRMIKKRALACGLNADVTCHTFRATGITTYLANFGSLEEAQKLANHASPNTTKLYDRTSQDAIIEEVEKVKY